MIQILIVAALGGWIIIGGLAWFLRAICEAAVFLAISAWRTCFEGAEHRYRRLRPWYRG